MSSFEFAFTLFGLVLGLSVTEIIGGFARVLRARTHVRLGWLTPLLGLLLFVDLVTFWTNAWAMRDAIPPSFEALLFGTSIAAIYYLSAALVFPGDVTEWDDLDEYFLRHKGQVILGVMVANLAVNGMRDWVLGNRPDHWGDFVVPVVYTSLGVILMLAKGKWLSGAVIGVLLSLYAVFRFI